MRIIRIQAQWDSPSEFSGLNRYEITYTMRFRGNTHYYTSVKAQDEMEAFKMVRQSILASEEQAGIKNVSNFELLEKQFPDSGYKKEVSRARRILKQIRNEIHGQPNKC